LGIFLNGANPETAFLRITCARKITISEKEAVILLPDKALVESR
jgi:hypothetical protein